VCVCVSERERERERDGVAWYLGLVARVRLMRLERTLSMVGGG
jgi:hypothetical protein